MSSHNATTAHPQAGAVGTKKTKSNSGYITLLALVMMNVTIVAGIGNDVQQAFYGLSSVTLFTIGALIFFIPTGLVAAELASGWSERGGIFRWVGEGLGPGWAFATLLILWAQVTFNFGSGVPSATATIGFFTSDFEWAVKFAEHPTNELLIMSGWLLYYWGVAFIATKGVKIFAGVAKYGVLFGTFLPLAVMTILAIVWLAQGNTPNIEFTPSGLIPPVHGMTSLALAAGVLFSFAGIDMNAAHIKQLRNPRREFPAAMFIAMILSLIIFIVGTLIIAIIIPNKELNVLYSLYATYRELGATIGMPWLYMVFVYLGLAAGLANLITNLAGPSLMLGQAGRSGFLPKGLQNTNKHGMPSRLMYLQMALMTVIAFIVFLLPNVEGFVILVTQSITILYMGYYVLMFIAFLKLRYDQPNRPRTFKVPGGKIGAWGIAGTGLVASIFGIVLSLYPPEQVKKEVGSGTTYVTIVVIIVVVVALSAFGLYRLSRKRDWVDPNNAFAPFTWEIEGLKKPGKVESNVPTEMMSVGQNPMGMPIKRPYSPNDQIVLPPEYDDVKHRGEPKDHAAAAANLSPAAAADVQASAGTATTATATATATRTSAPATTVPQASAEEVAAAPLPDDPIAAAEEAARHAKQAADAAEALATEAEALAEEAVADRALAEAQQKAKAAHAAAEKAADAANLPPATPPVTPKPGADKPSAPESGTTSDETKEDSDK